jgi:hypothetical protein
VRTRLTCLALAALLALSAGATPALSAPDPGHDGPGHDDGSGHDGSGHHQGPGESGPDDHHTIGTGGPQNRGRPPTQPSGCGAPSGRVAAGGNACSGLSTPPAPTTTPTTTPAPTPTATAPAAAPPLTPAAAPAPTSPATAAAGRSAAGPGNPVVMAVVAGGVLLLLAMVVAGFRARARLGRVG